MATTLAERREPDRRAVGFFLLVLLILVISLVALAKTCGPAEPNFSFQSSAFILMPLCIGFDMDGVLADFSLAFHEVEERLFGPGAGVSAGEPEKEEEAGHPLAAHAAW